MNKFNFELVLENLIQTKQLVELEILGEDLVHKMGYIVAADEEYLTFAEVGNEGTFRGLSIYLQRDVECIQTESKFLRELVKKYPNKMYEEAAGSYVGKIKKFSFLGFVEAFENTDVVLEILTQGSKYAGKLVAHDDKILVIDEYYPEDEGRFARTYINPSTITSITVGGAWLDIIASSIFGR